MMISYGVKVILKEYIFSNTNHETNSDKISHKNVLAFRDDHKRSDEIRIEQKKSAN